MRSSIVLPALLVALPTSCLPRRATDTRLAVDAEVVVAGARPLDEYLARAARFGFSGTVLVADSGGVLLHRGYGWADRDRRVPLGTTTVYDMGSITKQFTAAAILLLQSEGRLSVRDSLPRFFADVPADKRGITLHQLLTHTAGIADGLVGDYDTVGRDSLVAAALGEPLVSAPGAAFNYSNAGFSMLGAVIERVTGEPWERFVRDRLLLPSGMRHTGYDLPRWNPAAVAHTFTPPVDHGTPLERWRANPGPHWGLVANGGMLTTTGDLYRWELGLRRGAPLPFDAQRQQFAPQFRRSATLDQGYDWWLEQIGGELVMHRGGDCPPCGLNSEYRRYPDGSTAILLANSRHNGGSTRRFVMARLRRLQRGQTVPLAPVVHGAPIAELQRIAGVYRLRDDTSASFVVAVEGDHLAITARGQTAAEVLTFSRDSASVAARRAANARAAELVDAIAAGSVARIHAIWPGEARAARLVQRWNAAAQVRGPFRGFAILGTTRTDRGALLTTAELRFDTVSVPVRFAWAGSEPTVNSEDVFLDAFAAFLRVSPVAGAAWSPYWWLAGDTIVTHDLFTGADLRAVATRAPDGCASALTFELPAARVTAARADRC